MKVCDKHPSLLRYEINCDCRKFYSIGSFCKKREKSFLRISHQKFFALQSSFIYTISRSLSLFPAISLSLSLSIYLSLSLSPYIQIYVYIYIFLVLSLALSPALYISLPCSLSCSLPCSLSLLHSILLSPFFLVLSLSHILFFLFNTHTPTLKSFSPPLSSLFLSFSFCLLFFLSFSLSQALSI